MPEFLEMTSSLCEDMVLVDTGSVDQSVEIVKSHGIEPFYFEWVNHFSKARNYSMDQAKGDWIVIMDVDDRLERETFEALIEKMKKDSIPRVGND